MTKKIEISYKTILFTFGLIGLLWLIFEIKDILLSLFVAFIIMSALKPVVNKMESKKIPRVLAILVLYIILIALIAVVGSSLVPILVKESSRLFTALPKYMVEVGKTLKIDLNFIPQQLIPASGSVIKFTFGVFSNVLSFIFLLVFSFYLLLERENLEPTLNNFFGESYSRRIVEIINNIEKKLGTWLSGQFLLCLVIAIATFIGLTILQIDYALPLALLAGLLEIIPTIGPIVSGIPAVIIALNTSPVLGLAIVALYFIIHQAENYLLVPNIMKKTTGLSPVVIIVSLMIGGKLMGLLGIILAVPFVLTIQVIFRELIAQKDKQTS